MTIWGPSKITLTSAHMTDFANTKGLTSCFRSLCSSCLSATPPQRGEPPLHSLLPSHCMHRPPALKSRNKLFRKHSAAAFISASFGYLFDTWTSLGGLRSIHAEHRTSGEVLEMFYPGTEGRFEFLRLLPSLSL